MASESRFVNGFGFVPTIPARELKVGMWQVSARYGRRKIVKLETVPKQTELAESIRVHYDYFGQSLYLPGTRVPVYKVSA